MWKFTSYCTIMALLIFLQHHIVASSAAIHLSPTMQKNALFQFKLSLAISNTQYCYYRSYTDDIYVTPSHPKTMNWSMSSNYCTWEGVSCEHKTGNVIGLDLSCSQLEGAILPNSTLFQLFHLQFLNLSHNQFSGRVPSGISLLNKLVSLDLSGNYGAELEDEVFKSLLQNMTQLRVLNLQSVSISSVLPVNLSTSLRVLDLGDTYLHGVLPQEVFHLSNLEFLYLSGIDLNVTLPKVKWGSSATLQHLHLPWVNINGGIPDSIGFLDSLISLDLSNCKLSGPILTSIENLVQLTRLELSWNNLEGPIPTSIGNFVQLTHLDLSWNNLNGPISTSIEKLGQLTYLDLSENNLSGQLPSWIPHKSQLQYFDCNCNLLSGAIPQSFFQLVNLTYLDFSSNNFSGVLDIEMFSRLEYLEYLFLSDNNLSVTSTSMATLPPTLDTLGLSSCNMKEFPHFSRDAKTMDHLDLSNNHIEGEIPHWIGLMVWDPLFSYLNLSHNRLTGDLEHLPWNQLRYLDLQSNMLNGSLPSLICNSTSLEILNLSHNNLSGVLPICPTNLTSLRVLDLRMNNIHGNIPATLSNFRDLKSLNLHGNKLEGKIPSSFAELHQLEFLDLGRNQINDIFPQFLEAFQNLQVLVLKSNKFHGLINKGSKVGQPFPNLRIIDLSYNEFSGPLPTIYFKNFTAMMNGEVNNIQRSYMEQAAVYTNQETYYTDSTNLVIKGVDTQLQKILTIFTTVDLSSNNYKGEIDQSIGNLVSLRFLNLSHNHLTGHIPSSIGNLSMLESLDLSFNRLEGEIPQQLTSINSLARLNLSCNQLTGHIPRGPQFDTFDNDSYVNNLALCGIPLSKGCEGDLEKQKEGEDDDYFKEGEDDDYFFSGFTWKSVVIGYGCGVVPAFIMGYLMLLAGKPKWFSGIIARELGLKIRRMEIKFR